MLFILFIIFTLVTVNIVAYRGTDSIICYIILYLILIVLFITNLLFIVGYNIPAWLI